VAQGGRHNTPGNADKQKDQCRNHLSFHC
jgi:hypothetical protein